MTDGESLSKGAPDALTRVAAGIAWLIVVNKPVYPLYVWWIAGHGLGPAYLAALTAPAFAALALLARRQPLWLRAGLPALGALDTAYNTKLFGAASGAELFFIPCALLAALLLRPAEHRITWGLTALISALAIGLHGRYGEALYRWTESDLAALFSLNLVSAAALSAFILIRLAPVDRAG